MGTTYYQRSTTRDYPHDTLQAERALETTTDVAATFSASVAANTSELPTIGFTVPSTPAIPSTGWHGTYTGQLDVTAAGASLTYKCRVARLPASGTGGSVVGTSAVSFSGTGLKFFQALDAFSEPASATDIFALRVDVGSTNMMQAESLTLRVNTTDSYVTTPWDFSPSGITARPKYRISSEFWLKAAKHRSGGVFTEKQMKIRVGGNWVNV